MINFSQNTIISENQISFKRSKTFFKINEKVYNELRSLYINCFSKFTRDNKFYDLLFEEGIVINDNHRYNPFLSKFRGLKRVFVQLTNRCNLMCEHCYAESCPTNNNEISIDKLIPFLDFLIKNGVSEIDFTGGEVFTYKNIWELLNWIENQPVKTVLFTNLTLLCNKEIEQLSKNNSVVKVVTSIDYFSSYKHNNFRHGNNAYERTMQAIFELKKRNVSVTVNTIVMSDNHDDVFQIVDFFSKNNIDVVVDTLLYEGRMSNKKKNFNDIKENCYICNEIINRKKDYSLFNNGCGVGDTLCYLGVDGKISLCPSLTNFEMNKKFFQISNFNEIIQFLSRYSDLNSKCKLCHEFVRCRGGCRARAFFDKGNLYEKDIEACYKFGVEK